MSLRVYNTLTGKKEEFVPLEPGKVKMYVCGVTVYDHCHIGHARANVVFDMIYRYLKYAGYDVTYVRNYTDIDDKIINRANRDGIPWNEVSERFIAEFDKDMAALALELPTYQPKATEHIPEIIAIVQQLIHKGHAYAVEGDVYFRVATFADYLKLSKRNMEEMQAGARVEVDERKENPMDFKTGGTGLGVSLGTGAAGVAHRVFGHEHEVPWRDLRYSRRRQGPSLPPP